MVLLLVSLQRIVNGLSLTAAVMDIVRNPQALTQTTLEACPHGLGFIPDIDPSGMHSHLGLIVEPKCAQ